MIVLSKLMWQQKKEMDGSARRLSLTKFLHIQSAAFQVVVHVQKNMSLVRAPGLMVIWYFLKQHRNALL